MEKNVTVRKEGKEYQVPADGAGVVWLSIDEEVVDNPEGLICRGSKPGGMSRTVQSFIYAAITMAILGAVLILASL